MAKIDVLNVDYLAFMIILDPTSFQEAAKNLKWREAMDVEIRSIEKNQTYGLSSHYLLESRRLE